MKKDKFSNGSDTKMDPSGLPRSVTSSRSSGRTLTPVLPITGIQGTSLRPAGVLPGIAPAQQRKAGKRDHSMQELQHMAQLKEQHHQRSCLHISSSDLHVPTKPVVAQTGKARVGINGKKKKKGAMAEMLEAETMAEVAHSRAAFNRSEGSYRSNPMRISVLFEDVNVKAFVHRKNGSLPGIGQSDLGINHAAGKLPKINEPGARSQNHVIEIINKHEPVVRVRAALKEISTNVMKNTTMNIPAAHANNAPEIILQNEAEVGKAYDRLSSAEYYKMFGGNVVSRSRSSRGSSASREF